MRKFMGLTVNRDFWKKDGPFSRWSGKFLLVWLLLFIICLVARLPHLLSENSFLDDDEAIIGIMAQNLLGGKEFPYYFLGQNYGMSFFETISVAFVEFFIGSGVWTVRIAMLIMLSLGMAFIFTLVKRRTENLRLAWFVAITFSLFPSWYIWGMLARGGYLTGFVASCLLMYLLFAGKKSIWTNVWIGLTCFIIYESHPLFIVQVVPFLLYYFYQDQHRWRSALVIGITAFMSTWTAHKLFIMDKLSDLPPLSLEKMQYANFAAHMEGWMNGLSGYYFLGIRFDIPVAWLIGMYLLIALLLIFLILAFYRADTRVRIIGLLSIGSILFGLSLLSAIEILSFRYMLAPISGLLFLILFLTIEVDFKWNKLYVGIIGLATFGALFGGNISRHWYQGVNLESSLRSMHESISKKDVKAIIALDHQYYWNYLFGEEIPATNLCRKNRTNYFCDRAWQTYDNSPEKVNIIGWFGVYYGIDQLESFNKIMRNESPGLFLCEEARPEFINKARESYTCYD